MGIVDTYTEATVLLHAEIRAGYGDREGHIFDLNLSEVVYDYGKGIILSGHHR